MGLPRVRMDFNTTSLGNSWTVEDVKRQGIELHEGMKCIFYDFDAEEGKQGILHTEATVWWDAQLEVFSH